MENTTIKGNKQIAGAIIIVGVLIAGAIMLRGTAPVPGGNDANAFSNVKIKPVSDSCE